MSVACRPLLALTPAAPGRVRRRIARAAAVAAPVEQRHLLRRALAARAPRCGRGSGRTGGSSRDAPGRAAAIRRARSSARSSRTDRVLVGDHLGMLQRHVEELPLGQRDPLVEAAADRALGPAPRPRVGGEGARGRRGTCCAGTGRAGSPARGADRGVAAQSAEAARCAPASHSAPKRSRMACVEPPRPACTSPPRPTSPSQKSRISCALGVHGPPPSFAAHSRRPAAGKGKRAQARRRRLRRRARSPPPAPPPAPPARPAAAPARRSAVSAGGAARCVMR